MIESAARRLAHELVNRREAINRELSRNGVRFGIYKNGEYHDRLFPYDPVPRIIESDEYDELEKGCLTVAGRTDTGVHASHQVCHLDVNEETLARCVGHMQVEPVMALMRRLQRMLPNDIAIRSIKEAPEGFDARFSALERTYVYRIADRSSEIDPRIRNSVLHIDDDLDIDAMNKAAEMTIGLHDFGSFATPNPGGTTIRKVKTAYWRRIPQHPLIDDGTTMGERYRTPALTVRPSAGLCISADCRNICVGCERTDHTSAMAVVLLSREYAGCRLVCKCRRRCEKTRVRL